MSGPRLASSPTWYCGNAIDSDARGILYFVGNCSLFLLDYTQTPPQYVMNLVVCRTRAVGVSVCRASDEPWRCVTAGDGKVRLWDLDTRQATNEHQAHKSNAVTCIQWSAIDSDLVVSADSSGHVVAWHLESNTCHVACPNDKVQVSSLACSPHHASQVALGYKDSTVFILDVTSGLVLQRMRGHDEEIQGLAWCPVPGHHGLVHDDAASEEVLLASGSKDRSIRVWATTSGHCVMHLPLPPAAGARREKGEERFGVKLWVAVHWPENSPTRLISSSYSGEILQWNLSQAGKQKHQVFSQTRQAAPHKRIVFNLATGGRDGNTLCSVSMDRQIVLWDVEEKKARCNLATLGGFAYCIEQSPINPGHIAVGCGDHLIRVWNVDNPHSPADAQVYWQGLKSKVTTLSWHPLIEGKLAYGTDDGRVGVYDLIAKHAKLSSTFHKGTVYTVVWGPRICAAKGKKKDTASDIDISPETSNGGGGDNGGEVTWCVFSCGDGRVMQHQADSLDRPAANVMDFLRKRNDMQGHVTSHSDVRWKPDYSAIAIGNDDGSVHIFGHPSLRLLCVVQVQRTLINALRWHPRYTSQSEEVSVYRHWLAIASSGSVVKAVDLSNVLESANDEQPPVITHAHCELAGHNGRVTGLSWSMLCEMQLASVSYDHTVQVWDVRTGTPRVNYRGHTGRLLCVAFSDLDPDLVYSGGQDNALHCWQISEQMNTLPQQGFHANNTPSKRKNKDKKKNRDVKDNGDVTNVAHVVTSHDASRDTDMAEISRLLEAKKRELSEKLGQTHEAQSRTDSPSSTNLPDQSASAAAFVTTSNSASALSDVPGNVHRDGEEVGTDNLDRIRDTAGTTEEIIIKKDGREKKKKRHKSLFPTSSLRDNRGKALQHEDCITLAKALYKERPDSLGEEWFHLGHLLDRRATHELYRHEINYHISAGNWEQHGVLEMFRGNIATLVAKARDEGHLSDWMLGLSPVATTQAWRDLCVAYAAQLGNDNHHHKAATYLLAANKVYEAVALLRDAGLVKDAVCLARIRLAPQDPVLVQLFTDWATNLAKDANLELAAKCYLGVREPLEAARCLAKRPDPSATLAATMICVFSGHVAQARVHVIRLMHDGMAACDWSTVQRGVSASYHFRPLVPLLYTHELLVTSLMQIDALTHGYTQDASSTEQSQKLQQSCDLPTLLMTSNECDAINPWPLRVRTGEQCFMHTLIATWSNHDVCLETGSVREAYDALRGQKPEQQGVFQLSQVVLSVAYDVTLGVLQALLGDCDRAAEHWSSALATILEQRERHLTTNVAMATQCQALAEGVCQLLLPRGPSYSQEMMKQIYALAVTVNKTSLATSEAIPFTLSIHQNNSPDDIVCSSVNTSSHDISAWDCLKAFYSYCVLLHWQSKFNIENNASRQGPRSGYPSISISLPHKIPLSPKKPDTQNNEKVCSNNSNQHPVQNKSTNSVEDIVKELEDNLQLQKRPNEDTLCELSRNLLWNIQVEKFKIKDSLHYIKQAVANLVSKNRSEIKSVCSDNSDIEGNWRLRNADSKLLLEGPHGNGDNAKGSSEMDDAMFLTPKHGAGPAMRTMRAMSGEYIPMDRGRKGLLRRKPHFDLIQSQTEHSQHLAELDSNQEADELQYIGHDPVTADLGQQQANDINSDSLERPVIEKDEAKSDTFATAETKVYERALSIFSDDLDNETMNLQQNSCKSGYYSSSKGDNDQTQNEIETKTQEQNVQVDCDQVATTYNASEHDLNSVDNKQTSMRNTPESCSKLQFVSKQNENIENRASKDSVRKIPRNLSAVRAEPESHSDSALQENEYADPVYLSVPEEWYLLPVDEKYVQACATLELLSREQVRLQTRMESLERSVKELPFPDSMISARVLWILSAHGHQELHKQLREWILQNGYLREHRDLISEM